MNERSLIVARAVVDMITDEYVESTEPIERWIRRLNAAKAEVERLERGGLPHRPPRRMPSCARIAAFHGRPLGECWRCGQVGYVERAHLIDRVFDGLDGV